MAVTAGSGIDFELSLVVDCFRKCWVDVDVGVRNPLLLLLWIPAAPSSGWEHARLAG